MQAFCQFVSVCIGLLCFAMTVIGILPGLGASLWLTLSLCLVGVIFGAFPRRKIGLTINVAVAIVAMLRLLLGGGIL
jgi:hypothetical protein